DDFKFGEIVCQDSTGFLGSFRCSHELDVNSDFNFFIQVDACEVKVNHIVTQIPELKFIHEAGLSTRALNLDREEVSAMVQVHKHLGLIDRDRNGCLLMPVDDRR